MNERTNKKLSTSHLADTITRLRKTKNSTQHLVGYNTSFSAASYVIFLYYSVSFYPKQLSL